MKIIINTFAWIIVLFNSICLADDIKKVSFSPMGSPPYRIFQAVIGDYKLELESEGDYEVPDVWDSPVYICRKESITKCKTESLLVTGVYYIEKAQMILIDSYSGSMSYVDLIDINTCKAKFQRVEAYTEGIFIGNNQIQIYPACDYIGEALPMDCSAARVLSFDKEFQPVFDKNASDELTKKIIGVKFEGKKLILYPKTKFAQLITE